MAGHEMSSPAWSVVEYSGDRVHATLEVCERIVQTWGTSQLVRKMARDIANQYRANSAKDEARAVQIWIHNRVKYRRDPQDAELVQDPITTVKNGGDCDDMAILAASLLRAIGHDARVATVQWKGRKEPSHAVCADLTARSIVDAVPDTWPEEWPPLGFEVEHIRYLNNNGTMVSMDGLFSKLVKALAKPFEKIFPPKTLLGKIMDPLGLNDPKRNLNLTGRVADVVGTAAALVTGAYLAAPAAAAGSGFWATAGAGAMNAGAIIGSKLGYAAAGLVASSLLAKVQAGQALTPAEQQQLAQNGYTYTPASIYGPATVTAGGGGGGGDFSGMPAGTQAMQTSAFPIVPVALGAALLYMIIKRK